MKELKHNSVDAVFNENKKNLAFDQSAPILYLMKFTGLLPFDGCGTYIVFHVCRISFFYTITVYSIVIFFVAKMLIEIMEASMTRENCEFNCLSFLFVIMLLVLQAVLIPVLFWSQITNMSSYYRLWFQFQEKYRLYSNPSILRGQTLIPLILRKNPRKLIYTIILASFALSLALSCFGYGLDFRADIFIGYFVICYFINVAVSFWSNQCHMVRAGAENIRQFFTQLLQCGCIDSSSNLQSVVCELWMSFNAVLKLLVESQKFLLTLLTSSLFLSSMITIYCFVSQILSSAEFDRNLAVVNFILSVWSLKLLHLLNDSAFAVMKQVDFRTWVISINLNKTCVNEVENQVVELLSFFENQVPQVGLFGLEFLSRSFFVTITTPLYAFGIAKQDFFFIIFIVLQTNGTYVKFCWYFVPTVCFYILLAAVVLSSEIVINSTARFKLCSTLITYIIIILQFRSTKLQAVYSIKCNSSL